MRDTEVKKSRQTAFSRTSETRYWGPWGVKLKQIGVKLRCVCVHVCWKRRYKLICGLKEKIKRDIIEARSWRRPKGWGRSTGQETHFYLYPDDRAPTSSSSSSPNTAWDILLSRPSITLSDHAALSQALMVLHILFSPCWSPNCFLSNSDLVFQTQLTDHCHWEIFLILPFEQGKCFSSGIQTCKIYIYWYTYLFWLPTRMAVPWTGRTVPDPYKSHTQEMLNEWMNGERKSHWGFRSFEMEKKNKASS